LRGLLKE